MLITRSARRTPVLRYFWHRALRILPALWVCLLVSAFAVAPLVMLREHGSLAGFWASPGGPVDYVRANMWTGLRQFGVHDLFAQTTAWGRKTGASVFDGALWSLSYEMLCYIMIGLLAVLGVFRRARAVVLVATVGLYAVIVASYVQTGRWNGPANRDLGATELPLLGLMDHHWVAYLTFLFMLGAVFELYREHIPINDALGFASAAVFLGTLVTGGFFLLGFPAFAYLLIWLSIRMPKRLHAIGRKNDYSYGIYIYGFLSQQIYASLGYSRWGYLPFTLLSLATAAAAAWLSWHLIEKHALGLKGWTPRLPNRLRRRRPMPEAAAAPAGVVPAARKGDEPSTPPDGAATGGTVKTAATTTPRS
jgi:peptidoglycan/LPS O-acetylase OafA/YrhL